MLGGGDRRGGWPGIALADIYRVNSLEFKASSSLVVQAAPVRSATSLARW